MYSLAAIQKVELVGGNEGWVQEWSALILAVAAIGAAALAAYVAVHNQRRQLTHDRYLRNQEHMRNTIDAALVSANEGRNVIDLFLASIETVEEIREEGRAIPPEFLKNADDNRDEALAKLQGMRAAEVRLETRLGRHHPIATSHHQALIAYNKIFMESSSGLAENREGSIRKDDEEREKAATEAFEEFQDACHAWFQSLEREAKQAAMYLGGTPSLRGWRRDRRA